MSTEICNQALGFIGAQRINDLAADTSNEAIQCRLHFEPTRDALIRSFRWRFAAARAQLTGADTTGPLFEFDNQFALPTNFLALRSVFGANFTANENTRTTFAIEGQKLLTNDDSVDLRYTAKITDSAKFDPLFVETLVVQLADKFVGPLGGGDAKIQDKIDRRLLVLMPRVRAMDRQETNTIGRLNRRPWVETRLRVGAGARRPSAPGTEAF